MTKGDIILVYVSWRDLHKNAKNMDTTNLTILDKEGLKRTYTESLSLWQLWKVQNETNKFHSNTEKSGVMNFVCMFPQYK